MPTGKQADWTLHWSGGLGEKERFSSSGIRISTSQLFCLLPVAYRLRYPSSYIWQSVRAMKLFIMYFFLVSSYFIVRSAHSSQHPVRERPLLKLFP